MVSIEEASIVKKKIESEILKKENVNGLAIGYKVKDNKETNEICIVVFVDEKKKNVSEIQMIPTEIDGIKTDVRQRAGILHISGSRAIGTSAPSQVMGGIAIGPARTGTFGTLSVVVLDRDSNPMALSCAHVLAVDRNDHRGDDIILPFVTGRPKIGELDKFVFSSNTDAAVARLSNNVIYSFGINLIEGIQEFASREYTRELFETGHRNIKKSGVVSGFTQGTIEAIHSSITAKYEFGQMDLNDLIQIKPAIQGSTFSSDGDSGSCIIDEFKRVIGIIIGVGRDGYTYANHIQNITEALKVTFVRQIT